MKVYLAGPMRGISEWNVPAFDATAKAWTEAGHHVFSPAATLRALGYLYGYACEPGSNEADEHLRHVMLTDFACIVAADAIALLPGWEKSRGATVEVALAHFFGKYLFDAARIPPVGADPNEHCIDPDRCPWHELAEYTKQPARLAYLLRYAIQKEKHFIGERGLESIEARIAGDFVRACRNAITDKPL